MKRMAIFLAAMGISVAAFAESSDVTTLPEGESAYGYSMSDPYTDGTIIVQEIAGTFPADIEV